MRICMMSSDYLPNPGGIASHVHFLTRALLQAGHEISLLACCSPLLAPTASDASLSGLTEREVLPLHRSKWCRPLDDFRRGCHLRQWHRTHPYDLIHFHTWPHDPISIRAAFPRVDIPLVCTAHWSSLRRLLSSRHSLARASVHRLLHRCSRVIAVSRYQARIVHGFGVAPDRVQVVPNGVDADEFRPNLPPPVPPLATTLRQLRRASTAVAVWSGRAVGLKRLDLLLQSVRSAHAAGEALGVLIVGDGPDLQPTRALADRLGIAAQVAFTGAVSRDQIPRLLAAADLGVVCSDVETFGLSTIETMACARPVVGTATGATPEIVRDGETGLLVPHNDASALGSALASLSRDHAVRFRMGAAAREQVLREYTWPLIAAQTVEVYRQALSVPAERAIARMDRF